MIVTDCINEYFALIRQKPELFADSSIYNIVTDIETIEKFQCEQGEKIGVIYKSPFNTLVVDLVEGDNGLFTYERIIPTANGKGVVCIPVIDGKFLLLNQYRHCIRTMQLSFPRGFGVNNLSPEENAKKELVEETDAEITDCIFLGSITTDSGLIGSECDVFLSHISSYNPTLTTEGITNMLLLSSEELEEKIAFREIKDSFTLSAYSLLKTSNFTF